MNIFVVTIILVLEKSSNNNKTDWKDGKEIVAG